MRDCKAAFAFGKHKQCSCAGRTGRLIAAVCPYSRTELTLGSTLAVRATSGFRTGWDWALYMLN